MLAVLVPATPLHVSIPLLQMRLFQPTIASCQPLPLLPRNFRNSSSSCTIFSDSHCFCGAMAAVKIPRLQDLESATMSVKTAAIIHASRKNGWLHRNQKIFQCEERQHKSVQAKRHKTSTKFKVYQCSLLPKKGMVETDISTFHIISFNSVPPDPSPHQRSHTSR